MEYLQNQGNIYQNNISQNSRNIEYNLANNAHNNSINGMNTGIIPRNFNQNIINKTNKIKKHEQLQDIKNHNNDTKDNFMISPLSGERISVENFSHNNMTPFFGSNVKQSTTISTQPIMENYTGNVYNYRNKSEVPTMFDPSQRVHQVNGTPVYNEELLQRYVPSDKKQNESPVRKVNVGPGLNQGYSNIPCGGLNQSNKRDFIMPKTVDELRVLSNPKKQYKGRVISGLKEKQRGLQSKVVKNLPDRYYNNSEDRYFTSVVTPKNKVREKVRVKRTNRQCSRAHTGAAGPTNHERPSKRGLYRKSRNNTYLNSGLRNLGAEGNWDPNKDTENYGKDSFDLPLNERDTTQKDSPLLNLTTAIKSIVTPIQDLLKTTKKENFIGNERPNGNMGAQMPKKMTVHDVNDIMRTTVKETTLHDSEPTNLAGPTKLTVYDPNDVLRTTIKETNIHEERVGNMAGPSKLKVHDPNDIMKTTIKETNIHDNRTGNLNAVAKKGVAYDPNNTPRTTIKETNIHNNRSGTLKEHTGSKPKVYQLDEVRPTVRNTLEEVDKTLNLSGEKKSTVYDPNDVPLATIKDTNIHHTRSGNIGNPGQNKEDGYLVAGVQAPNTHRQFTSDNDYTGNPDGDTGKGGGEGYLTANYEAKNINRQFLADNEYVGTANSEHEKPKSYDDAYNAELNYNKEKIATGREPTKSNVKVSVGESDINIDIKKLESDIINIREMNVNKIYSAVPGKLEETTTTSKIPLQQDINVDRIENDILQAFKENPYTQSLSSF
jgi:hypothetical protein